MTQNDMHRMFIIGALYPDIIREQQHLLSASMEAAAKRDKHKALLYLEASKMLVEKAEKLYERGDSKKEERVFWENYVEGYSITDKELFEQSRMFFGSIAPLRSPDEIVKSMQKENAEEQALKPLNETLKKIVSEYGEEIYKRENSKRLKSILDDFVMGKQNLKTLNIAIQEGIPERLLSCNNMIDDEKHFVTERCINQLEWGYGISKEKALETVNYFSLGLGWEIKDDQTVATIQEDNISDENYNRQFNAGKIGFDVANAEIARKQLVMFYMIDVSENMKGTKIATVNEVMRKLLPVMKKCSDENADAIIKLAVMQFSSGAEWITQSPMDYGDFAWNDLDAGGASNLGKACELLNSKLSINEFLQNKVGNLTPVIILMSVGKPTDDFTLGLAKLKENRWFRHAIKIAVAFGDDANNEVLKDFTGSSELIVRDRYVLGLLPRCFMPMLIS